MRRVGMIAAPGALRAAYLLRVCGRAAGAFDAARNLTSLSLQAPRSSGRVRGVELREIRFLVFMEGDTS